VVAGRADTGDYSVVAILRPLIVWLSIPAQIRLRRWRGLFCGASRNPREARFFAQIPI
jgi:hypothetical protein